MSTGISMYTCHANTYTQHAHIHKSYIPHPYICIYISYLYGSYDAGLALRTHAGEHAETVDIELYIVYSVVYMYKI